MYMGWEFQSLEVIAINELVIAFGYCMFENSVFRSNKALGGDYWFFLVRTNGIISIYKKKERMKTAQRWTRKSRRVVNAGYPISLIARL